MKDLVGPGDFNLTNCGSLSVEKTGDDSGSQAGAEFTLYEGSDVTGDVVDTCTVTVASEPDCIWASTGDATLVNVQPGTYTIDETVVPDGYEADASLPHTFTVTRPPRRPWQFVNIANPATLTVHKEDDAGNPLAGVEFTLYEGSDTTGDVVDMRMTDASGDCIWVSTGTDTLELVPGTYTIDETDGPAGYLT